MSRRLRSTPSVTTPTRTRTSGTMTSSQTCALFNSSRRLNPQLTRSLCASVLCDGLLRAPTPLPRPHRARLHHSRQDAARPPRLALRAHGVCFNRGTASSLSEVSEGKFTTGRKVNVVVNASGVGAKMLGGCEDADVLNIRCARSLKYGSGGRR
jgi:hypothetical protein